MDALPKELQVEILTYLSPKQLLTLSLVSKYYNRLARSDILWARFVKALNHPELCFHTKHIDNYRYIKHLKQIPIYTLSHCNINRYYSVIATDTNANYITDRLIYEQFMTDVDVLFNNYFKNYFMRFNSDHSEKNIKSFIKNFGSIMTTGDPLYPRLEITLRRYIMDNLDSGVVFSNGTIEYKIEKNYIW